MTALIVTKLDPCNTSFIDVTGRCWYSTSSVRSALSTVTTVTRGDAAVIGTIEFRLFGRDRITLPGRDAVEVKTLIQVEGTNYQ